MALGTWTTSDLLTFNVTIPAGSNRIATLFVGVEWTSLPTFTTPTIGGVSMTLADSAHSASGGRDSSVVMFYMLESSFPANGTQSLVWGTTGGASVQGRGVAFAVHTDCRQEVPNGIAKWQGASATTTPAMGPLAYVDGSLGMAMVMKIAGANLTTVAAPFTERWDRDGSSGDTSLSGADVTFSGTGNATATFTNASSVITAGLLAVVRPLATGPTIDTQPTAATVRINGDTTTSVTFTVAATTSGGSLTYDWELETSVGGGSYSNLADGSGATWTGQTSASAVGTFTAKTLSGRRVRCNVTDDNGTTTTDAVVLTVLDGPVLSASTVATNGSGVAAPTMTSDDALSANGEILLITMDVEGQVLARTTVRPA